MTHHSDVRVEPTIPHKIYIFLLQTIALTNNTDIPWYLHPRKFLLVASDACLLKRGKSNVGWRAWLAALVDFTAMPDLNHCNQKRAVHNFIDDSINALTYTIALLARKLFTPRWARIFGQHVYSLQNSCDVLLRDASQIFGHRLLE